MSWLSNLFTSKDKKVEIIFMSAMDNFANKDYSFAYKGFLKAFKMTKSNNLKLTCLENAARASENLNNKNEASNLLFEAAKIKASLKESVKDIAETLEKSYSIIAKEHPDKHAEIYAPLMLFKIAAQEYSFVKKLNKKIHDNKVSNKFNLFAMEVYDTLIKDPEIVWKKSNFINFPSNFPNEFKNYTNAIQDSVRNSAALSTNIVSSSKQLQSGELLSISTLIKNYTPLTISKVELVSGSKGSVLSDPEGFPRNLSSKEEINLSFDLQAQLTGQWGIGPLIINYMIGGKNYEYKSDVIQVEVLEGEKNLDIQINPYQEIEEDFEYEVTGELTNNGKTDLENINLKIKVPKEGKISLGTSEKKIFELRKGETFTFTNNIRFEAGILGKKYKIRIIAEFEGGSVEKEFIISSQM